MKKLALVLGLLLSVFSFCLTGCGEPEQEPWWKDKDNIEVEITCTIPGQERVLERYHITEERESISTFYLTAPTNVQLTYPFTDVKLYYKGEPVEYYYRQFDFDYHNGFGWWDYKDFVPGYPVPDDFNPWPQYCMIWTFYERSNTATPSLQGIHEGINFITSSSYYMEIEMIYVPE